MRLKKNLLQRPLWGFFLMSYKIPGSIWKNITPGCTQGTDPEFLNPVRPWKFLCTLYNKAPLSALSCLKWGVHLCIHIQRWAQVNIPPLVAPYCGHLMRNSCMRRGRFSISLQEEEVSLAQQCGEIEAGGLGGWEAEGLGTLVTQAKHFSNISFIRREWRKKNSLEF